MEVDDLNELEALDELLNVPLSTQTPPPADRVVSRVAEPAPAIPTSVTPSCPESSGIDRLFNSEAARTTPLLIMNGGAFQQLLDSHSNTLAAMATVSSTSAKAQLASFQSLLEASNTSFRDTVLELSKANQKHQEQTQAFMLQLLERNREPNTDRSRGRSEGNQHRSPPRYP